MAHEGTVTRLAKKDKKSKPKSPEGIQTTPIQAGESSKSGESTKSEKVVIMDDTSPPSPEKISKNAKKKLAKKAAKEKEVVEDTVVDLVEKKNPAKKEKANEKVVENVTTPSVPPSKKSKKSKVKEPSPEPEPELNTSSDDEPAQFNAEPDSNDENVHLHGFSTDDDDSSDEENDMDFEPPTFDVGKLPTIAKDDTTVKRKLDKAKRLPAGDRGVLFLGRLPHGFFEDQMKAYFSQFGTVTRIRLSRNKKTGRSKHYGFIEFDSSAVAQIVADTMDNYLIMGHILRCKVIPNNEVHPELWIGANRKWRPVPRDRVVRVEHNKPRTEEEQIRAAKRLIRRQNERKRKLADAGIKYSFEAVGYKRAKEIEL